MKQSNKELVGMMELAARDMTLAEFEAMAETEKGDLKWVNMPYLKTTESFVRWKELTDFEFEHWEQIEVKSRNILRLKSRSSVAEPMIINKGGWLFPQKIYCQNPNYLTAASNHRVDLDEFVLRQPLCHSLYTRYKFVVEDLLPKCIHAKLRNNKSVKIVSLGSGTGDDVMQAMKLFGPQVTLVCYEIDTAAIEIGRQMAKDRGLEKQVEFKHASLRQCSAEQADIAIMVGIICSLPDMMAEILAKVARKCLKQEGTLIVSAASDKVGWGDPLSRFMSEYCANLFLEHRNAGRMERILTRAGYEVVEVAREPLGFHWFVTGNVIENERRQIV
jgi:ubiquinone/menaquinone biosynthesis C-methylase UbiE